VEGERSEEMGEIGRRDKQRQLTLRYSGNGSFLHADSGFREEGVGEGRRKRSEEGEGRERENEEGRVSETNFTIQINNFQPFSSSFPFPSTNPNRMVLDG